MCLALCIKSVLAYKIILHREFWINTSKMSWRSALFKIYVWPASFHFPMQTKSDCSSILKWLQCRLWGDTQKLLQTMYVYWWFYDVSLTVNSWNKCNDVPRFPTECNSWLHYQAIRLLHHPRVIPPALFILMDKSGSIQVQMSFLANQNINCWTVGEVFLKQLFRRFSPSYD